MLNFTLPLRVILKLDRLIINIPDFLLLSLKKNIKYDSITQEIRNIEGEQKWQKTKKYQEKKQK